MRFSFLILLGLLMLMIACAPVPRADATPRPSSTPVPPTHAPPTQTPIYRPRVLRINLSTRPDSLDPQRVATTSESAILQLAYEGLTRIDEKGNIVPGAAERWNFSADGKTLTFRLRAGLKRVDGTPLTAKDFEFAFKRAVDPRIAAPTQSFLDPLRGAETAYSLDAKSKPEDIDRVLNNVGVKAIDDATLVFTLAEPVGFFPAIASTLIGSPIDKRQVEKDLDAWWLSPANHNGNGAFKIIDVQDQVIKLAPNPNYWGGKAKLDRIEFYWLADAAALEIYRRDGLEMMRVTTDTAPGLYADATLSKQIARAPAARVTYLGFNLKRAPFTDKNVRKAFSQALDREMLARDILKGLGKPYLSWIPPGMPGYDESSTVPGYSPFAAVQTLIDAGYGTLERKVNCTKLGAIKLTFANTPRAQVLFQAMANNLSQVIGCPISLDPVEPNAYPVIVRDPKTTPQFFLMAWEQEYAHPQNWLFLQTCAGVYANRLGYCNRDFDAVFQLANQEIDAVKAIDKYKGAQKIFIDDLAAAFLWNNDNAFLVKPYLRGIAEHLSTGDNAWLGQAGPVLTYDIDTTKVGAGYPAQ